MNANEIKEAIENMTSDQLVEINNRYCEVMNYSDDGIFVNDEEFFSIFFDGRTIDAIRATFYGEYKFADDYVRFNAYGNLDSFKTITTDDLVDLVDTMSDEIAERFDEFEDLFN